MFCRGNHKYEQAKTYREKKVEELNSSPTVKEKGDDRKWNTRNKKNSV